MDIEQDYTFVTIDDSDFNNAGEAFIVDVDSDNLADAVIIDDNHDHDMIVLSDDTVFMTDADMIDMSSIDHDHDLSSDINGPDDLLMA